MRDTAFAQALRPVDSLATLLLALTGDEESITNWLSGIVDRAIFAYRTNKAYPCTLRSYGELLEHPMRDEQYRKTVTEGSILFPFIAVIAACLRHTDIYEAISKLKSQELDACTFQYWYPDSTSEENIYITGQGHGAVVTDVAVERPMEELLDQIFGECANMPQYGDQRAAAAQLLAGWHSSGVCEQGKDRPLIARCPFALAAARSLHRFGQIRKWP